MSAKLARIVHTTDGATLRTRGEAATYMTALPEQRARYNAWQHAAKLMLDGADAEPLTTQIEFALMLDGRRRIDCLGGTRGLGAFDVRLSLNSGHQKHDRGCLLWARSGHGASRFSLPSPSPRLAPGQ